MSHQKNVDKEITDDLIFTPFFPMHWRVYLHVPKYSGLAAIVAHDFHAHVALVTYWATPYKAKV